MNFADQVAQLGGKQLGTNTPNSNTQQTMQSPQTKAPKFSDVVSSLGGQELGQSNGPSFAGQMIRGAIKPFAEVATSGVNLVQDLTGQKETQPFTGNYLGEVPKVGAGFDVSQGLTPNNLNAVQQSIGTGADIASWAVGGEGASNIAEQGLKGIFKAGAKTGATVGAVGGFGNAMEQNQGLGDVAKSTAFGGLGGALIGGGLGLAGAGVGKAVQTAQQYSNRSALTSKLGEAYDTILNLTPKQTLRQETYGVNAGQHMANLAGEGVPLPIESAGGKLNTTRAIDTLTKKVIAPENELMDSLVASERKYVNWNDLKNEFKNVSDEYSLNKNPIATREINSQINAIEQQYADKMITTSNGSKAIPLEDINRIRRQFNDLNKATFLSSNTEKIQSNVNVKLGNLVKSKMLDTMENDTGKQLLKRLSEHQNLKRILATQNGKNVGMSALKQYAYKVATGLAGNLVGGHTGGVIGYWSGAKVGQLLENPNIDTAFLRQLLKGHIKDPAIIKEVERIIAERDAQKLATPKLGEASFIPMGGKTAEGYTVNNAGEKSVPNMNTGSFTQKAETSKFTPSNQWQEVPQGKVIPPGGTYKLDNASGKTFAKWSNLPNKEGGFVAQSVPFKNEGNLTTKILKDLEGKTTVSKQYILDATNRGELKQAERDITRQVLEDMTRGSDNPLVQEAKKYKTAEEFVKAQKTGENFAGGGGYFKSYTKENSGRGISMPNLSDIPEGINLNTVKLPMKIQSGLEIAKGTVNQPASYTRGQKVYLFAKKSFDLDKLSPSELNYLSNNKYEINITQDGGKTWYKTTQPNESQLTDIYNQAQKSDTINVKDFADKVKSELLPLKVKDIKVEKGALEKQLKQKGVFFEQDMSGEANMVDKNGDFLEYDELPKSTRDLVDQYNGSAETYQQLVGNTKYENISLPSELRGNVKNYKENIYESPIKTSAGSTHFDNQSDNYFGHTRIEDMADNKTRRVIEVQSDLYQKGNLEKELAPSNLSYSDVTQLKKTGQARVDEAKQMRANQLSKLQQYNDPTAHFRMIREEIKKASQDGKTKLQFPTGETAMKIEGLGSRERWTNVDNKAVTPENLKVGESIYESSTRPQDAWIITDVLGDGKFKAVPKSRYEAKANQFMNEKELAEMKDAYSESFDISGKVDTNNPIYKFYEKDVQKYLNKFGGKRIVDDKGVSWIEIPITKEQGKAPVEAFGKIKINPLLATAGITAGATYAGAKLHKKSNE